MRTKDNQEGNGLFKGKDMIHSNRGLPHKGVLVLILGATLLIRLLYGIHIEETPFSDMEDYESLAIKVLAGKSFGEGSFYGAYSMPGLPIFLAGIYRVFGVRNHMAVKWIYAVLSVLMALMVYDTARRIYSEKAALISVFFLALSKEMVFWGAKPAATEFMFSFLMVLTAYFLVRSLMGRRLIFVILAGVSMGAAYLVRPVVSLSVAVVVGLYLTHYRLSLRMDYGKIVLYIILFAISFILTLSPWISRNYRLYGCFLAGNTNSWYAFSWGNNDYVYFGSPPNPALANRLYRSADNQFKNDLEASKHMKTVALQWVKEHPGKYFSLIGGRFVHLFSRDYVNLTKVDYDQLEFYRGIWLPVIGWKPAFLLLLLVSFLFCLLDAQQKRRIDVLKLLPLLLAFSVVFLYALVEAMPRFRHPLMPLFYISYGFGIISSYEWGKEKIMSH